MPTGTMCVGGHEFRGQRSMLFLFYMYVCVVCVCQCALCEYRACRGEKKVLALLEPELKRIASRRVGAEN